MTVLRMQYRPSARLQSEIGTIVIDDQLSAAYSRPSVSLKQPRRPFFISYTGDPLATVARSDNTMNYDRLYVLSGAIYQLTGLIPFFPDSILENMLCPHRT